MCSPASTNCGSNTSSTRSTGTRRGCGASSGSKTGTAGSSVYSTTLRRNRTENFTRRFTVDTTHRRLHLDFLDFREKPLRPSVTVTGLEIDYIPTTSVAVDSLYRQQLDLRIFADEFLRAAIQADSL